MVNNTWYIIIIIIIIIIVIIRRLNTYIHFSFSFQIKNYKRNMPADSIR